MKILVKEGTFRKVSNDWIADNLVKTMGWTYSSRSEWKKNDRDLKELSKQVGDDVKNILDGKKPKKEKKTKIKYEKIASKI